MLLLEMTLVTALGLAAWLVTSFEPVDATGPARH